MIIRLIIFLVINFLALYLGGLYTTDGVISEWYLSLNKAPWTPPGWVFGAAWSLIMICFSIFLAKSWTQVRDKFNFSVAYIIQLILNIAWNPIFFSEHKVGLGLIVITSLFFCVLYLFLGFKKDLKALIWLLAPYLIWLMIATSLNAYIFLYN